MLGELYSGGTLCWGNFFQGELYSGGNFMCQPNFTLKKSNILSFHVFNQLINWWFTIYVYDFSQIFVLCTYGKE